MRNPEHEWEESDELDAISEPQEEVPWSAGDAMLAVALLVPAWIVASTVLFFLAVAGLRLSFQPIPKSLPMVVAGVAAFVASAGLVWILGRRVRGASYAQLGFNGFKVWLDVPLAILGQIIAFVGMAIYAVALRAVSNSEVPTQLGIRDFGASTAGFAVAFVVIVILAPIGEEMLFRGFLYPGFRKRFGVAKAMLLTSAVFALFHFFPLLYTPMFIIGMVLVILYEYRGTLAPSILLHSLNNFLALLAIYGLLGSAS